MNYQPPIIPIRLWTWIHIPPILSNEEQNVEPTLLNSLDGINVHLAPFPIAKNYESIKLLEPEPDRIYTTKTREK